jgi:hypothetical protein
LLCAVITVDFHREIGAFKRFFKAFTTDQRDLAFFGGAKLGVSGRGDQIDLLKGCNQLVDAIAFAEAFYRKIFMLGLVLGTEALDLQTIGFADVTKGCYSTYDIRIDRLGEDHLFQLLSRGGGADKLTHLHGRSERHK